MSLQVHAKTPTLNVVDPRGLAVRTIGYHRAVASEAAQARVHHTTFDAAGRAVTQRDPRQFALAEHDAAVPASVTTIYSMSGQVPAQQSVDAGSRATLFGEAGQPLHTWEDMTGPQRRIAYDTLLRPRAVHERLTGMAPEHCVERFTYAGPGETDATQNRCGRLIRHDDPAGTVTLPGYGLHGQALAQVRRFLRTLDGPDWPEALAEHDTRLEPTAYATAWTHDAQGAVLTQTDAQGHVQGFAFDVAGQLHQATLTLTSGREQTLLHSLDYNAGGQILTQTAGNNVITTFAYAPANGRLTRCAVRRIGETAARQDVHFAYDPVGNVVRIEDQAQPTRYYKNRRSDGVSTYTYDSRYQLIEATGRESATARIGPALPALQFPGEVLTPYAQTYTYDAGGNLIELRHQGAHPHTHTIAVAAHSNRAMPWQEGQPLPDWDGAFDAHGNLLHLSPGGQALVWNARQQLHQVTALRRAEGLDDTEVYVYDGNGQRVRKASTAPTKAVTRTREVRYLPGLELRIDHVSEEALTVITATGVRVLHWTAGRPGEVPNDQARYTISDHLGSRTLELDQDGTLISHEGYYPYGGTAWWAGRNETEADYKTIRYSGKERDATGLYYYGFRYYVPWLQRWLNPDPAGDIDGLNRYRFAGNNPTSQQDMNGLMFSRINKTVDRFLFGKNIKVHATGVEAIKKNTPSLGSSIEKAIPLAQDIMRRATSALERDLAKGKGPSLEIVHELFGAEVKGKDVLEKFTATKQGMAGHSFEKHLLLADSPKKEDLAYTAPAINKNIYLTKKAAGRSDESIARLLIHEMSHVYADTKDYWYPPLDDAADASFALGWQRINALSKIKEHIKQMANETVQESWLRGPDTEFRELQKATDSTSKQSAVEKLNSNKQLRSKLAVNNAETLSFAAFMIYIRESDPDLYKEVIDRPSIVRSL